MSFTVGVTRVRSVTESLVGVSPLTAAAAVFALGVASGAVAGVVAFAVRAYSREPSPAALNVLSGLGAIAVWLNLTGSLGNFIGGETEIVTAGTAVVNVVSLSVGGLTATYGGRLGDRAAVEFSTISKASYPYEGDVTRMVKSAGRTVTVSLPDVDRIRDIDGYDPVSTGTKEKIAGKRLVFPRGLTVEELRGRVSDRLKERHEVGYVDVELNEKGEVEFLGIGRGVSGIGPTLGPGTCAVALHGDPAHSSGPGDNVQIWRECDDGSAEHVASGELHAATGDTVTVALDENDAAELDPSETHRVVTLPPDKGPERKFASMLRSADETMSVLTVSEGSPLVGAEVGSVGANVVAVRTPDGGVEAVPPGTRVLSEGDSVYAVGRPEELRGLETFSEGE